MPESATDWPYDALPGEIAERYRIPIIRNFRPRWAYSACVAVDVPHWGGLMPDDEELQLLRRYLDFRVEKWHYPAEQKRIQQQPFDIDPGVNITILFKRAEGDWTYRQITWTMGDFIWPAPTWGQRYDLAGIIERIENLTSQWSEWQAAHPG